MAKLQHVKPGAPIEADLFNAIAAKLERFANLAVAGRYLRLWSSPTGKCLAMAMPQPTWALLSGSTSPYSFQEVRDAAAGTWEVMANGDRGTTNVYELNDKPGLAGKVVPITWTAAGDWRFQWVGFGTPTCENGRICVTIDSDGCSPATPVYGATVTIHDSADPPNLVATGLTSGTLTGLTLSHSGSGYTNGTGYPLGISGDGSGAAGTFDVVGGQITNLVLTDGGSHYTSATITFPGAGPGTGAAASATVKGQCCLEIPSAGNYGVTVQVPGATDRTATINAVCNQDNHVSVTFPSDSLGTVCFTFLRCTSSGTIFVPGATVSTTGTGVATGTGDANGQLCLRVGHGSYTATITYPSGATRTLAFEVMACSTTNVTVTSITSVCFEARTNAPGCTGSITVTNDDDGTILGTGSITTTFDGAFYTGQVCVMITEVFFGDINNFGYDVSWPLQSYHSSAVVACYQSSIPLNADSIGAGC
ncbi:hypothetical protein SAMN05444166_0275 [Singulisphaera sp. GP187]|uniref:hypothetical protein n=1 Tax=Singulisphaera sp. GP187 TaxID=1882752 RepID=UPI0009275141|nr:hypothetical protein [Singulisphaera sp. GP187]SIN70567.1 hypothetical protein SAMN05444166_0275 [Singulisphaera sp. GP187]